MNWKPTDTEIVPTPFIDKAAEGKTFRWLVENRPEFCNEVRDNFKNCTGFWTVLQSYLLKLDGRV